jgi:hypothetical protein
VQRRTTHATVVLTRGSVEVATWPLVGAARPDVAVVGDLARLQLAAHRLGCSIRLRDASVELSQLLDLVGLREVLRCECALRVEVRREPEQVEETGIEEVVVPDDPVA